MRGGLGTREVNDIHGQLNPIEVRHTETIVAEIIVELDTRTGLHPVLGDYNSGCYFLCPAFCLPPAHISITTHNSPIRDYCFTVMLECMRFIAGYMHTRKLTNYFMIKRRAL